MKNNIFNLDHVVVGSKVPIKDLTMNKALMLRKILAGGKTIDQTVSGNAPIVLTDAVAHAILSLKQYGLCTQDGTPTPSAPVDIMTNNGVLKFGWHDIITTSALSGYGTYVSPSGTAGNRAYKWFKDLPNGTYTFAVDGDYEIIVQWRDPADTSVLVPSSYENLSGWMTSGEVVLDKESGGYGIAVRRTVGTSSITPSNFDGTLHVQEQGIYTDGTPEVLTVHGKNIYDPSGTVDNAYIRSDGGIGNDSFSCYSAPIPVEYGKKYTFSGTSGRSQNRRILMFTNDETPSAETKVGTAVSVNTKVDVSFSMTINVNQASARFIRFTFSKADSGVMCEEGNTATDYQPYFAEYASVPMLLSVGDVKDEAELISGIKTGRVVVKVFDGTEELSKSSSVSGVYLFYPSDMKPCNPPIEGLSTHFPGTSASTASMPDLSIKNTYGSGGSAVVCIRYNAIQTVADFKAWLASEYANGTPVIVVYPLATPTTEQTTAQHLATYEGTNIVDAVSNVTPTSLGIVYKKKK